MQQCSCAHSDEQKCRCSARTAQPDELKSVQMDATLDAAAPTQGRSSISIVSGGDGLATAGVAKFSAKIFN